MNNPFDSKCILMILGTAAGTGQGGISTALPSYFEALKRAKIDYEFVATHEAGTALHKFLLYFGALNSVTQLILQAKKKQANTNIICAYWPLVFHVA